MITFEDIKPGQMIVHQYFDQNLIMVKLSGAKILYKGRIWTFDGSPIQYFGIVRLMGRFFLHNKESAYVMLPLFSCKTSQVHIVLEERGDYVWISESSLGIAKVPASQ